MLYRWNKFRIRLALSRRPQRQGFQPNLLPPRLSRERSLGRIWHEEELEVLPLPQDIHAHRRSAVPTVNIRLQTSCHLKSFGEVSCLTYQLHAVSSLSTCAMTGRITALPSANKTFIDIAISGPAECGVQLTNTTTMRKNELRQDWGLSFWADSTTRGRAISLLTSASTAFADSFRGFFCVIPNHGSSSGQLLFNSVLKLVANKLCNI